MCLELCDRIAHERIYLLVVNCLTLTMMRDMILNVALIAYHNLVFLAVVANMIPYVFFTSYLIGVLLQVVGCLILQLIINHCPSKLITLTEVVFEDFLSIVGYRGHFLKALSTSSFPTTDQYHGVS